MMKIKVGNKISFRMPYFTEIYQGTVVRCGNNWNGSPYEVLRDGESETELVYSGFITSTT